MSFQRKIVPAALAAVMALSCAACAGQQTPAATTTPTPAVTAPAATVAPTKEPEKKLTGPFAPEGSVIFEKDGIKVTTAGLDNDPTSTDPVTIIWINVENSGTKDVCLGVTDGSVNGFMQSATIIEFLEDDGTIYGSNNAFGLMIPAGGGRYALSAQGETYPGVNLKQISELTFSFYLAEDEFSSPYFTSDPVTIETGLETEKVELDALGTVLLDNDKLKLVAGEQDYDDYFGPIIYLYAENKTDQYISLSAASANADGKTSDYIYYHTDIGPGKRSASSMYFDSDIRELKGFEELTLNLMMAEAKTQMEASVLDAKPLDSVTVKYPPQIWGKYDNGGLSLEIQPKYNNHLTVETPENDPNGILIKISETASLKAGPEVDGAGELLRIGKVTPQRFHEMLCSDMSGAHAFAKDAEGNYFIAYYPTDVRYARETVEQMREDQEQWTMLTEWAQQLPDDLASKNHLEQVHYGNSAVDMLLARAVYQNDVKVNITGNEFGSFDAKSVDGGPYADFLMQGLFGEEEVWFAPEGKPISLEFPDEKTRLDFFPDDGNVIRMVQEDRESYYIAGWYDDDISYAEAMQGWYYAAAEKAGARQADTSLDGFLGTWSEKDAGRGTIVISRSLAPGKVKIEADWPESASVMNRWRMTAALNNEGKLVYEQGVFTSTEFNEKGEGSINDDAWGISGEFTLSAAGELNWHDGHAEGDGNSTFIRNA